MDQIKPGARLLMDGSDPYSPSAVAGRRRYEAEQAAYMDRYRDRCAAQELAASGPMRPCGHKACKGRWIDPHLGSQAPVYWQCGY